ncbi:hypothetical protein CPB86DRAFT_786380 [Serendipita vermifera]|nr:hypothetical protein CPB86DRAFT_786380 [Serendipita vermifera]
MAKVPTLSWFLCALFIPTLVESMATVYLRPSSTQLGTLSVQQGDVLLAHHLGLPSTVPLNTDEFQSLLDTAGGQASLGEELLNSEDDSLLVVLDAQETYLRQIIPDSWSTPSFTSDMGSSSLTSIVDSLVLSASRSHFAVYTDEDADDSRNSYPHKLLDMYDFAVNSEATAAFMKAFDSLVEFIEGNHISGRRFGAFHLSSLRAMESEYGLTSDAFQSILLAVKATLSSPSLQGVNLAVVVALDGENTDFTRRKESAPQSTQAPFPIPPGNAPIFSRSTCFTSAETCRKGTTECSGRGQCVPVKKGSKQCYVCQCAITKDAKHRREYWSGAACEVKDVSTAFTLVAGTTIAIIVIIVFSISLLYSVGSQELPNVLTGTAVHAKRD